MTDDRERLMKYIKSYVKKHDKIPNTTLDFYRFVKLLGKGAFGKVKKATLKANGELRAVKIIDKLTLD